MELKKCTKCGQAKPPTTEYYNKASNTKDGLQSWCKECKRINHLENREERIKTMTERYRELNPIEILPEGMKRCSRCNEIREISEFNRLLKAKDGLRYECKECRKKEYHEDREGNMEKSRQHYHENKDWISERNKKYREINKEWYREYHKE